MLSCTCGHALTFSAADAFGKKLLAPGKTESADTYAEALTNIRTLWQDFPMEVRRDILRTYVPEGFRVIEVPAADYPGRPKRVLRAEVCGNLLEAAIEILDPPTLGKRPARRAVASVAVAETLTSPLTWEGSSPHGQGGKVGAAGLVPLETPPVSGPGAPWFHELLIGGEA